MELREKIVDAIMNMGGVAAAATPQFAAAMTEAEAAADRILAIPELKAALKCMCCGEPAEVIYCERCSHYANMED